VASSKSGFIHIESVPQLGVVAAACCETPPETQSGFRKLPLLLFRDLFQGTAKRQAPVSFVPYRKISGPLYFPSVFRGIRHQQLVIAGARNKLTTAVMGFSIVSSTAYAQEAVTSSVGDSLEDSTFTTTTNRCRIGQLLCAT